MANNIGALVVVNTAGQPIGILSERDIIRVAAIDEAIFPLPVNALMTREVVLGMPHDDLEAVAHTMTEKRIRHVPVVDQGKLVGIVSIGDVVKAQRDQYQGELYTLQTQILANEL
jgi:CBS domain-containing protein